MTATETKMPPWRVWLVCEVAVWGWALGFIQLLFAPLNRVFLFWTRADAAVLAAVLLLDGTLVWAVVQGLRKILDGRLARMLEPVFFFWLVLFVANWFPNGRLSLLKHFPWLTGMRYYLILWVAGMAAAAVAAWRPGGRCLARAGWRALGCAWLVPVFLSVHLFWISAPRAPASRAPTDLEARPGGEKPPVVFVILDMIAASEVVDAGGRVAEDLPNLGAFSESATYFANTTAPGLQTLTSIPGICLQQRVGVPKPSSGGRVLWPVPEEEGRTLEIRDCPLAVPRQVRLAGGRSLLCSYYLPWMDWFTGEWAWDAARTSCFYGMGAGGGSGWSFRLGRLELILSQWTEASKTPLAGMLKLVKFWEKGARLHYAAMAEAIQAEGTSCLRHVLSPGDFALLHQPLPHPPFVFDEHGNFRPHLESTAAAYRGQLRLADACFGEWMEALKASGRWEESWIVVTSDHGLHSPAWSRDPASHDKPHVPLWVKAPGQTGKRMSEEPIRLDRLSEWPDHPWPFSREKGGGGA